MTSIPTCDDCGEEFDPMFGVCRNVLHKQRGDTQETQAAEGEAMTPERLSYLMQENLLRGECSATRDELHWIFTQLATMTKRAEEAERELESSETTRLVQAQAAEAKLATAVEALRWYVRGKVDGGVCAYDTLRAIGIDPSKEQEK